MSRGNEFSDDGIERLTAIAAAAFAIHSVEESEIAKPGKKVDHRPETSSFPKTENFKEDNRVRPPRPAAEPDKISQPFPDDPEEGSAKKVAENSDQQKQRPIGKITDPSRGGGRIEPERPVAVPRAPGKPQTAPIQARPSETKADIWEKAEMAKIKERYQKVKETISYWESKKKEKAMRKFEASQGEGVKRSKKIKGRRRLEEDMEFIKNIAGEARAKADGKKKNEILKANQKADIIRRTGDLPLTCCC